MQSRITEKFDFSCERLQQPNIILFQETNDIKISSAELLSVLRIRVPISSDLRDIFKLTPLTLELRASSCFS